MRIQPFIPYASQTLNATAASVASRLPTPGTSVRIANTGANLVYVAFGDPSVVATINSVAILVGSVEVFSVEPDPAGPSSTRGTGLGAGYIAVMSPSGSNINVVSGEGC